MRKAEKVARIGEILEELYPTVEPPLEHHNPFTLLVAVLLSAQTTDKMVNTVTPTLFERFPTPQRLGEAQVEDVLQIIRPLGLAPQKAKNLVSLGQLLVQRHDSEVPNQLEALEALPGVGHKTASVVVSQAFGVPAFPVDTHIQRISQRLGISGRRAAPDKIKAIWEGLMAPETFYPLHIDLIQHGRRTCQAQTPRCELCPLQALCDHYQRVGEWAVTGEG